MALGPAPALQDDSHPRMLHHACGFALADQGADTRLIQDYLGPPQQPVKPAADGRSGSAIRSASFIGSRVLRPKVVDDSLRAKGSNPQTPKGWFKPKAPGAFMKVFWKQGTAFLLSVIVIS